MDERDTTIRIVEFMSLLVNHLRPTFPYYASALADEIQGKKMTNDRWNRIAAILASLATLPGKHFGQMEHDARNPALSAIVIAQKMASVTFGGRRDIDQCLNIAIYLADEIEAYITPERSASV